MKRLFFGLRPDNQALFQCEEIIKAINKTETLRPVPTANLHITLLFLGNVNPEKELALIETANHITFPDLSIYFDQLTFWAKPQILCLTSSRPPQTLQQLAGQLKPMATTLGLTLDSRPFVPHATLAKKVKRSVSVEFKPFTWQSAEFALFESLPSDKGVIYRPLHRWLSSKQE